MSLRASVVAVLIVCSGFAVASGENLAPVGSFEQSLSGVGYMPKDPLAVWVGDVGMMSEVLQGLITTIEKFLPEEDRAEFAATIAQIDQELGFALSEDLLAHLGPQFACVVDLPPVDAAFTSIMMGAPDSINKAMDGIAIWMQIDNEAAVATSLAKLFEKAEAQSEGIEGKVRVWWPPPEDSPAAEGPPPPSLYYGIGDGVLVFGFTPERVDSMLKPLEPASQLTAGADFQKISAHLDTSPNALIYLNLPRLQELIRSSNVITAMMAEQEEARPMMEVLLDPAMASSGIGATLREVGDGVRQVTYGPKWVAGGAGTAAIVAAIAIPNFIEAVDRGRQKRTMADIRTLGTAFEMYAVDSGGYAASDGWVDCAKYGFLLEPDYLEMVPTEDAWEMPLRCFSDGLFYRIVSGGKDGEIDPGSIAEIEDFGADDIVYGNGSFLYVPEGE